MWKRFTELSVIVTFIVLLSGGCSTLPEHKTSAQPVAVSAGLLAEYHQALALMQSGEWQEASLRLEDITLQNDHLAGPWLNLGIARAMLGATDKSEAAFKQSVECNPVNPVAYNQLGILNRHLGRYDEARTMYEQALRVAPDDPDTHWNLGILHDLYLHDTQLAQQHYERYQQLTGSDDRQLHAWIAELRQRNQTGNMTAGVKP